ncbi:MAG: hypothetical protein H0U21_07515 [Acidimicrobiia bacterium]|nr:hypothetical protein [Acidimicrobiia bacterium]
MTAAGDGATAGTIADPIICGPYEQPHHHFELGLDGSPTGELVPGRRPSESFIPVPAGGRRDGELPGRGGWAPRRA